MSGLVSCGWLQNAIRGSLRNIRVLETCWAMRGSGQESFLEEHIPSSNFFDLWKCCTPTQERPRALHDPKCFEEYAQSLGINNDSHIIIYDKGAVFYAARLWFQFKAFGHNHVSVVDGGMIKWLQDKLPVETGPAPEPEAGEFKVDASLVGKYFKSFEDVSEKNYSKRTQVIDTRDAEYFSGSLPEPSPATTSALLNSGMALPTNPQCGHIPGAVNLYYDTLLHPATRTILPKDQILTVLKDKGIDVSKPITSLCFNGIAACLVPLALSQLDQQSDVTVYQGSWTEYSQRATSEMVSKSSSNGNAAIGG